MAILGFHFSAVYKEGLLSKEKKATIMGGQQSFNLDEEVQVYLSDKPNLLDGFEEKRIGKAVIKETSVKRVKDLTEREAKLCTHKDLEDLKNALEKWYNANEDSIVTFVRFELELF